jgi:hypothetical protein
MTTEINLNDILHRRTVLRQHLLNVGISLLHLRFHVTDANDVPFLVVTDLS